VGTRHFYRDQPSFLGQSLYGAVDARHTEPGHLCCASCHTSSAARARSLSSRTPRISRRCWVFRRMAFGDFAALALLGWYLLIPPVFSPMGGHPRSFNDLSAPLNRWNIWASFDSEISCRKEKQHLRTEAPIRLKFGREHPDQDQNGNIIAVAEAWQFAECVARDDPRLNTMPPK